MPGKPRASTRRLCISCCLKAEVLTYNDSKSSVLLPAGQRPDVSTWAEHAQMKGSDADQQILDEQ